MSEKTQLWIYGIVGAALIVSFTVITLFYPDDKGIVYAALSVLAGLIFAAIKNAQTSVSNAADLKIVKADLAENNNTTAKVLDKSEQLVTQVDGRMTQMLALMERLTASKVETAAAVGKAEGIVIGQNTPVAEQNPELAIDPTLKKDAKAKVGDKQ